MNHFTFLVLFLEFNQFLFVQSSCPIGFDNPSPNICVLSIENRTFSDSCPFIDTLPFEASPQFLKDNFIQDDPFWLPIKFLLELGIFAWSERDKWFGVPYNPKLPKDTYGDCVISTDSAVSCDSRYTKHCVYSSDKTGELQDFCSIYDAICSQAGNINATGCNCFSKYQKNHFCKLQQCFIWKNWSKKKKFASSNGTGNSFADEDRFFLQHQNLLRKDLSILVENVFSRQKQKAYWNEENPQQKRFTSLSDSQKSDENCSSCDFHFENYGEPKLNLYKNEEKIYLVVDSHLKLKRSYYTGLPFSCSCNLRHSKGYTPGQTETTTMANLLRSNFKRQMYKIFTRNSTSSKTADEILGQTVWCFGFKYPNLDFIISNVILVPGKITFGTNIIMNMTNNLRLQPVLGSLQAIFSELLRNVTGKFTTFTSWTERSYNAIYLINQHFATKEDAPLSCQIDLLRDAFMNITVWNNQYCLKEKSQIATQTIHWDQTFINQSVPSKELCVDRKGQVVTRKCVFTDEGGVAWRPSFHNCTGFLRRSTSVNFKNILLSKLACHYKIYYIAEILKTQLEILPIDIYLIARTIESVVDGEKSFSIDNLVSIINSIMDLSDDVLKEAQHFYNATDIILWNFEKALGNLASSANGYDLVISSKNILVQIWDLSCYNEYTTQDFCALGLAINDDESVEFYEGENTSQFFQEINVNKLTLGVLVPRPLLRQINEANSFSHTYIVLAAFKKRSLFLSQPRSKIISIIPNIFIPNYQQPFFEAPIKIVYKAFRKYTNEKYCVYWKYGISDFGEAFSGYWHKHNNPVENEGLYVCDFWHLTHFGLLISDYAEKQLNFHFLAACCISFLCMFYFLITVVWMENWVKQVGVKNLLNYSASMILQTCFNLWANLTESFEQGITCVIIALFLHFTFLSQASWVFVINFYQYKNCFSKRETISKNFYAHSLFHGWLLPVIPITLTFSINPSSYMRHEFCFVTGNELIYSVIVLGVVIMLMILGIYAKIVYRMYGNDSSFKVNANMFFAILLFLLFEGSWSCILLYGFLKVEIMSTLYSFLVFLQGILLVFLHRQLLKNECIYKNTKK